MNDQPHANDSPDLSPPLDAAVRAVLEQPLPEDAIERVKLRAKQLAQAPLDSPQVTRVSAPALPRRGSRSLFTPLAVAAALLIVATAVTLMQNRGAGQAFADMIAKVKAAGSVQLGMTTQFGRRPPQTGQMYLEAARLRLEQFDGALVMVGDFQRNEALYLDVPRKVAQSQQIDAQAARAFGNPIEQLRRAKTKDAQPLGQEILGGRRTDVYRLSKVDLLGIKANAEMTVWVDVESSLPVKIVIRDTDPKAELKIEFNAFVWNQPLDAQLFSLSAPTGYKPGTVVLTPERRDSVEPDQAAPAFVDGVLRDRVPSTIVWGPAGKTITALMRDPESVTPPNTKPHTLGQWDVASGKQLWSQAVAGAGSFAATVDGLQLATVIGYEVQIRDAATGKVTKKWTTDAPLSPLTFSPDGKFLAAGIAEWGRFGGQGGKESGGVQLWDVERGGLARSIADDKPTTFVRYSIDGKLLATSSNDGPVKLWNAATGELTRILPGRAGAAFSPDGQTIACVSATPAAVGTVGKVELYRVDDGSLAKSLLSEPGAAASYLLSVAFSPDGQSLAATDWNGRVTLWDVATGQVSATNSDGKAGVLCAAFAPDGASLALGSEDKTLRLWKLPVDAVQPSQERK